MHFVFSLVFLPLVYTYYGGQPGARQRSEAEILKDIHEKVDDLWNVYGSKYPLLNNADTVIYATCNLQPNPLLNATEPKITGKVLFKQTYPQGKLEAYFDIQGFPQSESTRAIHIHTFGDFSNGCNSAGGHYNPYSVNHPHHLGDFENVNVRNGEIKQHLSNLKPSLFGPVSVMGRSVVVHKLIDDLGKGNNTASLENGNAGARLACCVIGYTDDASWNKLMPESDGK
ncbi:extracellular superoxide dismutase [Cu-Zn]-like [Rana temporaria]|uniref:extracellular superoxide dismutase [Cu-Zn]-like n=1 Tax=Rana temporaria TaxID=8407 RepID=UPI001AACEAAC|nr:extracellular superoxide dismutase [Cu-Zn]-like [Rana temporaria]